MDPVTTALVAAITSGLTSGGSELARKSLIDAYDGIKTLLKKKFGESSEVVKAVSEVESRPDSKGRQATLAEEIAAAKADQNAEILNAAKALLAQVESTSGIRKYSQTATGSYIAQSQNDSKASVKVNQPKE